MTRCRRGNGRKASSSNKKLNREGTKISDLTTCVLIEIFLRLPPTSIICCKVACKTWYELLSQSLFSNLYLKNPPYISLVLSNSVKTHLEESFDNQADAFHLISLKEGNKTTQEPVSSKRINLPIKDGLVEILGSWNGLLCLVQSINHTISVHITNPMMGEYISLPHLTWSKRTLDKAFGFGFSTHYKAVNIQTDLLPKGELRVYAEIFTIGVDNKWRELGDTSAAYCVHDSATIINGAFHWLVNHVSTVGIRVNNVILSKSICAFDIGEERFRPIPLPPGDIIINGTYSLVGEIRGHLCVFVSPRSLREFDIWLMNEYGNAESWTKHHVLRSWIPFAYNFRFVHPPTTSWRDGEILAHSVCSPHLISYNLREETANVLPISGFEGVSEVVARLTKYIPNFLPLKEALKGKFLEISKVLRT